MALLPIEMCTNRIQLVQITDSISSFCTVAEQKTQGSHRISSLEDHMRGSSMNRQLVPPMALRDSQALSHGRDLPSQRIRLLSSYCFPSSEFRAYLGQLTEAEKLKTREVNHGSTKPIFG